MSAASGRRDVVEAYFRNRPGQPIRFEHIADHYGMSRTHVSIAISALMEPGVMPGLARVGRGTYQWDGPTVAEAVDLH